MQGTTFIWLPCLLGCLLPKAVSPAFFAFNDLDSFKEPGSLLTETGAGLRVGGISYHVPQLGFV